MFPFSRLGLDLHGAGILSYRIHDERRKREGGVVGCRKPFELARALWVCSAGRRDDEKDQAQLRGFGGRYSGRKNGSRKGSRKGTAATLDALEGMEMEVPGS